MLTSTDRTARRRADRRPGSGRTVAPGARGACAASTGRGGSGCGPCRASRPARRAISSYVMPSMSQSTTAARKSSGSASSASCTSWSNRSESSFSAGPSPLAGSRSCGVVGQAVEADPLPAAGAVQEQVRGDPVEPALEGPRGVRRQRAEDPDEDLLGQVLGVVLVAGQPVREPVDAGGVGADDLVPRRQRVRNGLGAGT